MTDRRLPSNIDVSLLRSFVTICQLRSFTAAADALLRSQSALSLQIKRLESIVDRKLLNRSTHFVEPTDEGRAFLETARRIVALNDELLGRPQRPQAHGRVRLGTPEDFATFHLPDVLARFARSHPKVDLEVKCDLTLNLLKGFRAGEFDLVLIKREPQGGLQRNGTRVWREQLVWVGGKSASIDVGDVLPLALSPEPCVYRKRAIGSLRRSMRRWRISYTCESLAGTIAAVKAGLGFTVLPREMVPSDLQVLGRGYRLPELPDAEIALLEQRQLSAAAGLLSSHIVESLESM
jgi:DNA-binding transcriptional LysR family regulator